MGRLRQVQQDEGWAVTTEKDAYRVEGGDRKVCVTVVCIYEL